MTDQELERRLERALSHAAPDDLEGVLSRCETRKGNVIPMKQTKTPAMRWLAAACLALLLVGGGSGVAYQQAYAVASVVSLDVNPSIELKVNKNEKVLSCVGLNEEAQEVLADMGGGADLKGTKLDVAVNAIVGSLMRHGYLDSISSAILISVEDKDQNRAAKLQQELTAAVDAVLQEQSANAAVLSQTLTQDAALEEQARENNISTGKAYLARQVMEMNGTIATDSTDALEKISALSVEELKDLLETGEKRIPIGKAAAQAAAEEYAGVLSVDSITAQVDPELDEARPHYEVELRHPTLGKFEYMVDAFTGEVLSGRKDILDSASSSQVEIGEKKAKEIALAHAGVTESAVKYCNAWLEYDNGRPECYEVEFEVNGTQYKYEIGLYDGAVLDYESETHGSFSGTSDASKSEKQDKVSAELTENDAKAAALAHAGVTESQTSKLKVDLEDEDGRPVYEVEFKAGNMEYEYKIDGITGAVLEHERDGDD